MQHQSIAVETRWFVPVVLTVELHQPAVHALLCSITFDQVLRLRLSVVHVGRPVTITRLSLGPS